MEIFCTKIAGETNQFVDFQFVGDEDGCFSDIRF
jgi:hypothetical protein